MNIYEWKGAKRTDLYSIFGGWQEALIWSCLQNCMGRVWTESKDQPQSAKIVNGDFCFLAGKVNEALLSYVPEDDKRDFLIMIPQNQEWDEAIGKTFGASAKKVTRYAIKKEPGVFKREILETFSASLPGEYKVCLMDECIYKAALSQGWSKDLCSQFPDYQEFLNHGLGVAVILDGRLAAGAASYAYYEGGIEIEIDTKEGFRKNGLATACGARLILECLKRGLYPSWDAQNPVSVALAEKLGYHFDKEYIAYEVCLKA